jgi:hypothetical protein
VLRGEAVMLIDVEGETEPLAPTFAGFLRGWSAYYIALEADGEEAAAAALRTLGVPESLAGLPDDGSDEEFEAFMRWGEGG